MELKEIMSVSGQGGLFKFISQARNGIIVESFTNKKRSFISASTRVSSLEDIAVYTESEEVSLKDVFRKIHNMDAGLTIPDVKSSPAELKAFMAKVLPDYDQSRVYTSDIKKIAGWYVFMKMNNLLDFESESDLDKEKDKDKDKDKETSNT